MNISKKIPINVIYYNDKDPLKTTGGVQTFAKSLRQTFLKVQYMTPKNLDLDYILDKQVPVICTNEMVSDIPDQIPVIGFQHGVGAVKYSVTRTSGHNRLRHAQKKASKRPNVIWIACAEWIASKFEEIYGNQTKYVIYHHIDTELFDGKSRGNNSKLILHDARTDHKGLKLFPLLEKAFPNWKFEPLDCRPEDVPDRMRDARAFVHLSRYEGNSIVCNEAMAMNLPCMFTNVGLMQDKNRPKDVFLIRTHEAYSTYFRITRPNKHELIKNTKLFLESLDNREYNPREWVLKNAVASTSLKKWEKVMIEYEKLSGWKIFSAHDLG
jgi:glycosyltransferase involved in cell wall biosynthesis